MKIEVGKKYRRRDGEIVEITHHDDAHTFGSWCPYWAGCKSYREDGCYMPLGATNDNDLIEEVVDEASHAGAEAFGKQMRGEYTTYGEVGQIENMWDSLAEIKTDLPQLLSNLPFEVRLISSLDHVVREFERLVNINAEGDKLAIGRAVAWLYSKYGIARPDL